MRVWEIDGDYGIGQLRMAERDEPAAGPGQIVLAMRAASLNYRDLATVRGHTVRHRLPLIPFSDGAGEVVAVGEGVTRFKLGDRACPLFFQSWLSGPVSAEQRSRPLGGPLPGVLQERMVLSAEGASAFPEHLNWQEAATLPCAALTAWRAIAHEAPVGPGDTVLVQGTGGVSIFALQFAKARGASVIVTSSSDAKLERAKALGADHLINYRAVPEWGAQALELTGGRGVDVVVEVGGEGTINQSLTAARVGGSVVIIGILAGAAAPISIPTVFSKNLRVLGISVGSREQFEAMCADIAKARLAPVIDRVFAFEAVPDALRLMEAGGHFGKIVVAY
jgi:NADPH:quinone reductase-like Zn-dependent oxidoreductase